MHPSCPLAELVQQDIGIGLLFCASRGPFGSCHAGASLSAIPSCRVRTRDRLLQNKQSLPGSPLPEWSRIALLPLLLR